MWETYGGFGETIASLLGVSLEEAATRLVTELRPLLTGRIGQPDDVARVIAYLISPAAGPSDRRRVGRRRQRITTVVKGDVVKPEYLDAPPARRATYAPLRDPGGRADQSELPAARQRSIDATI
jgi:hypothetical protein